MRDVGFEYGERSIQVDHVTIRSDLSFELVRGNLERLVPALDEEIPRLVASGETRRLQQKLQQGPELAIFLFRDHGALLKIYGRQSRAIQYEIGNPLTASKMTRHRLAAGLYAPLRVILYEDPAGGSVCEYDKPSSLFGQFGDEQVTSVAHGLDSALKQAVERAMKRTGPGDAP